MEPDPAVRRLERDAVIACAAMALVALAAGGRDVGAALGVVAGGCLVAVSYGAVKAGVGAMVRRVDGTRERGSRAWALVKFFTRHGILAVAAYEILVRWRLHPVGVLAGASSLVLAAAAEAVRAARAPSRAGNPH
jgi:hypothetical protein